MQYNRYGITNSKNEVAASGGLITVSATNHKSSAVQAGQKVLVKKEVVSGVANYYLYDATNSVAPSYLKGYTFGVAVNAIPQNQGGSVMIPADMGTDVGKYVLNTAGQGHAYFSSFNTNDADYGSNYLGYAAVNSNGYAQISLPNVSYTSVGTSLVSFAFKRIGSATESKHLVAKLTNSLDDTKIKVEEPEDVFRIYLTSTSSGYNLEIQYKKTDGTYGSIAPYDTYMTSNGDTLYVNLQLYGNQHAFIAMVNGIQIDGNTYSDLTDTENLRNYYVWNPSSEYACENLIAFEEGGRDVLGCNCEFANYSDRYFLGGKYYY